MSYADVAVDAPVSHSRTFSYHIPSNLSVEPGQLVWVPFGRRIVQGLIVQITPTPGVENTRDILQAIEPSPLVGPTALLFGKWLSRYYFASLFECLALFLPPGFKAQVRSRVFPLKIDLSADYGLSPTAREALDSLIRKKQMSEGEFTRLLGRNGLRYVNRLADSNLIRRQVDLPRPRTHQYECYLALGPAHSEIEDEKSLPARQSELLAALVAQEGGYSFTVATKEFGRTACLGLVEKGLAGLEWVRKKQPRTHTLLEHRTPELRLTEAQRNALEEITRALEAPQQSSQFFLLHGVTGSGKTEVYLRAIEQVVQAGKQAIYLIPEISLTPQTVSRLSERFPERVAVIHSRLKMPERFEQWWRIKDGEFDVVVGARSALFAPVTDLGLIVIDEEHEWTFKQEQSQPLYDARTTAMELARLSGACVVLGTATPRVETYHQARLGRLKLLELPERVGTALNPGAPSLPTVHIKDMREELRLGNRSIFSLELSESLKACVKEGYQAILFLNRRGSSPFVQCRDCGYVLSCRSCTVTLTYHSSHGRLVCHQCNRRTRVPARCRQCGGERIRQLGIGTQRVVDEVNSLIPGTKLERWDADSTRTGSDPDQIMSRLVSGETQVLVGTQVVAKGLDLPNVTLVGAVLADVGLHLPDFRAGERAFNLLCQVAGRAGRGGVPGKVIIQTYNPEHYAVLTAASQNYQALYRQEIQARQLQGNPPFNQLVQIRFHDLSATGCQRDATALARMLRQRVSARGLGDVEVIGPAPGVPERVRGQYRWNVLIRGRRLHRFLEDLRLPSNAVIDVDPAHLL